MADSSSRNLFAAFGHRLIEAVWKLGFVCRFFAAILRDSGASLRRFPLVIREIYFAGVLSMIIIVVSGLFVGMVLGLQGYSTLARFGSADALGALVALSLLRELGPVLAALLFASRSGSAITAEIGLMKATEQLDAMAVMAVNPIARVVAPRFWAGVLSMPVLAAIFNVMGIFGGYFVGVTLIGLDHGTHGDVTNQLFATLIRKRHPVVFNLTQNHVGFSGLKRADRLSAVIRTAHQ